MSEEKDPLQPSPQLLIKLGSLLVHYQEFNAPGGHHLDKAAIDSIESEGEVKEWMESMDSMAFLPKKRS